MTTENKELVSVNDASNSNGVAEVKKVSRTMSMEEIEKAIERENTQKAYRDEYNSRPEVKAARSEYNKKRQEGQKIARMVINNEITKEEGQRRIAAL
tara:strand:- start:592 stop:882 length:291 start_codon:yes stop_codon:yes gene_type:complete